MSKTLFSSFWFLVLLLSDPTSVFAFGDFFIENKGQIVDFDGKVRNDIICYGDIPGYTVYVTEKGISFVKVESEGNQNNFLKSRMRNLPEDVIDTTLTYKITRTDLDIPGLSNVKPIFADREQSYFNYYLGHCKDGILNASTFRTVEYPEIYEGVSIKLLMSNSKLLILLDGNNKNQVQRLFSALKNSINEKKLEGCCIVGLAENFQKINPGKDKKAKTQEFNDNIAWSSYIGGSGYDYIESLDLDKDDNIILGGGTQSIDFPVSEGCFQKTFSGKSDIILMKLNKYHLLIWCTYIGGNNSESCYNIKLSQYDNSIWFCGTTNSKDFPVSADALQSKLNIDTNDAYIGNFSQNGYRNYLTLYGGNKQDYLTNITIDQQGNSYYCGYTESPDFPVTTNAYSDTITGYYDVVVVKFDKAFNRLYSTFFGGTDFDYPAGIEVDSKGNIILYGNTISTDFPVKNGDSSFSQGDDFISVFDKDFRLILSTKFGGSGWESACCMTLDNDDNILIYGVTASKDFYTTPGAYRDSLTGIADHYAAKLDINGNIIWSTLWGGPEDYGGAVFINPGDIAVDKFNNVVLSVAVRDNSLPTQDSSIQKKSNGGQENYILILDKDGKYVYSTYIGGSVDENLGSIEFNSENNLFITGSSRSTDFITTKDAFQTVNNGSGDGYLIELGIKHDVPPDTCDETGFQYINFLDDENISYAGKAHKNQTSVRLTPATVNKTGAAWYKYLMPVRNGFTTKFSFKMSGGVNGTEADSSLPGADGLAFVIQNSNPKAIGGLGGKIGYDLIPNSIAVEFDLFSNDAKQIENLSDLNGNHVGVMSLGKAPNSSDHSSGAELGINKNVFQMKSDGTVYYSKVEYNLEPSVLKVYLSKTENSFGNPIIEVSIFDLIKLLNLFEGEWAYVGFTSATGSSYQNHDILSWEFCPKPTDSQQTGVEEEVISEQGDFMLYPNPVEDELIVNLGFNRSAVFTIYDLTGSIAKSITITGSYGKIDISHLSAGCWFVKIETSDGNVFFEKFVKK